MTPEACGPDDWESQSRTELRAAKVLAQQQMWQQAYQHAGLALELGLKAAIMRRRGMNRWPSNKEAPELYTHQLDVLAQAADLQEKLLNEVLAQTKLGKAWLVAKDFSVMHRYPNGKGFPSKSGQDMLAATDQGGLLTWLLSQKR
ncbi:hypothetical protein [Sediminicoccus sp. KRV36]|uniref:hypothetical protein n=1 Tax=Sediminicoccus sp. KRV36 TaxID=3133721 RepID=UPI00200C8486|nr:hypothetical protein [Sediminicoccus rosea]UPY35516.1 hypothetical protein LHU95_14955 [Sediminicoccus rosea]